VKYRKKPVVIDAEQFTDSGSDPAGVFRREEDNSPYVVTIHDQRCYVVAGDWIIPEPDGVHFYPCKDEVFQKTYEAVPPSAMPWINTHADGRSNQ